MISNKGKIHFIGVGGIGISALARHFLFSDYQVSGSDICFNENIADLQNNNLLFYKGHSKDNIPNNLDLVIYSPAISENNLELKRAKDLGIKTLSYPEKLAELSHDYFTIAISGTHGKSTTTAMTALILIEAGFDPTVIIGTKLKEFNNTNYRKGKSKYLLMEADEWKKSFLNYSPNIICVTNIDKEHLDIYSSIEEIIETFQKYISNLKENGVLILNKDDFNSSKLDLKSDSCFSKESLISEKIKKILQVPGSYNLENALAASKIAQSLGISEDIILKGLSKYKGSWRRFEEKEILIKNKKHKIILDYAHHPTELKNLLEAVKQKYNQKTYAIFQPHQNQRTLTLKKEFIEVFKNVNTDKFFVLDIYNVVGRDFSKSKINSKALVEGSENPDIFYIPGNLEDVAKKVIDSLHKDEIIVIIGAGDVYMLEDYLRD